MTLPNLDHDTEARRKVLSEQSLDAIAAKYGISKDHAYSLHRCAVALREAEVYRKQGRIARAQWWERKADQHYLDLPANRRW